MPGPVARAERRAGALTRAFLLALVCCLLGSCSSSDPSTFPSTTSVPSATSAADDGAAQSALDQLSTAIHRHDRSAFDQLISVRDPAFVSVAGRIYDNLAGPTVDAVAFRLGSQREELTPARRALLGPTAVARAVTVTWRLQGDSGPAVHEVWFTFLPGGSTVAVAATTDGPPDRVAQPFWLLERLTSRQTGHTTVLAGSAAGGDLVKAWARTGDSAVTALRARLPAGLRTRWNGDLVVEIPSTGEVFEQLLGVMPGSYAQIAAVAWPEGPDPATSAVRIVVNPELAQRVDGQGLLILATHEATHIATRSAASPAPTWLVEGFADYVAYDAHPLTSATAAAALLADVRAHGAPTALPADSAFSASAPGLALDYARSWLACRYLAEAYGTARLGRFYVAVDGGASVDRASESVFGLTQGQLATRWGHYLMTLADHG